MKEILARILAMGFGGRGKSWRGLAENVKRFDFGLLMVVAGAGRSLSGPGALWKGSSQFRQWRRFPLPRTD